MFNERKFEQLVEYISKTNNQSIDSGKKSLQKLSLDLLSNIANYGEASIEGLGKFTKINNKIEFTLSPLLEELNEQSATDIPLVLIKKEYPKDEPIEQTAIVENNNYLQNEPLKLPSKPGIRNRRSIFNYLLWSLFGICTICFLFCFNGLIFNYEAENEKEITNKISTDTISDDLSIFGDSIYENIESNEIAENKNNEIEIKENEVQDSIFIEELNKKNDNYNDSFKNKVISTSKSLSDLIEISESYKFLYNNTCIIVCGSFTNNKNANKMLRKVIATGLEPYAEKIGKFVRIGFVFDGNESDLQSMLTKASIELDKNSWIMQPKQD